MKFSIVIPAHNESENIIPTVDGLVEVLVREQIDYEIVIVNDHSTDDTEDVISSIVANNACCKLVENKEQPGFGMAVRCGLNNFSGDAVAIVMADASDDPEDVITYYRELEKGVDCVFGSRFMKQSTVKNYPLHKLWINRLVNFGIKIMFWIKFNDVTNAFKAYRRETIDGLRPLLSRHFNLTVELPLKSIVRGYSYSVVSINWYGRTKGVSNLKLKEMGSRYAFIVLYVWLEKMLSRGDYERNDKK